MSDLGVNWTVEALHGAKIIDELLCLMAHYEVETLERDWDYNIVEDALHFVAAMAQVPGQPVTLSLARYLRAHGLLDRDPFPP